MNGADNVIRIGLDEEYFATAKEMVAYVSAKLASILDMWPQRMNGRERTVNLEKYIPGIAAIYRVNYFFYHPV